MSIHKTEALILRFHDFRETSIIASFFTKDFGKISGILKGIRQEPGKFASSMELFSHNEVVFYRKRNSSLHLVSQCDMIDNFASLRGDIARVTGASYLMELLFDIMPAEDKNEEVFNLCLESLKELAGASHQDKIMAIFKIKVLALSGFKPHFDSCVSCGGRVLGQAKFSLSLGGLLCPNCFSKDLRARPIFRGTIATILHIEKNGLKNNLSLGMNPQIKKELDIILNAFLNFHLEKELKSQKVLNKMAVAV